MSQHQQVHPNRLSRFRKDVTNPVYRWITVPLSVWALTRLIILVGLIMAALLSGQQSGKSPDGIASFLTRQDASVYLDVVRSGYDYSPVQQIAIAVFPLYPLLVSFVGYFLSDAVTAALLISNLALLAALIVMYALGRHEFADDNIALRAIFYLAIFPTAFFYSTATADSLFLLFVLATVYCARNDLWLWAALCCSLAMATHIAGLAAWAFLIVQWVISHKKGSWGNLLAGIRHDFLSVSMIALAPISLVSIMLFLKARFDNPVAFLGAPQPWGSSYTGLFQVIIDAVLALIHAVLSFRGISAATVVYLLSVCLALAVVIWTWRRLGLAYTVLMLVALFLSASGNLLSMSRFLLGLFPVFFAIAFWSRQPSVDRVLTIGLSLLLGVITTAYVLGFLQI